MDKWQIEAMRMVRRTRNPEKRRYAQAYLDYLTDRGRCPDERDYRVSGMAKQEVRLTLDKMRWEWSEMVRELERAEVIGPELPAGQK